MTELLIYDICQQTQFPFAWRVLTSGVMPPMAACLMTSILRVGDNISVYPFYGMIIPILQWIKCKFIFGYIIFFMCYLQSSTFFIFFSNN